MTSNEYLQLKAFARIDGLFLGVLWVAAFLLAVLNISEVQYSFIAMLLMAGWPFFLGMRLKKFRDYAREGEISFMRGWAYCMLCAFYAALIAAAVQYLYFAYFDHGHFINQYEMMMNSDANKETIHQMGMQKDVEMAIAQIRQFSPAEIVYQFFGTYLSSGAFFGAIIAMVMRKKKIKDIRR